MSSHLTFPRLVDVLVDAIHLTFFYVSLQNVYHISISPIAQVSSKMGVHRAKTMSLQLCVISGKTSQTITIKQNVSLVEGCTLNKISNH